MYTKPAPPILPSHSDWSDEDWNAKRPRERERRKKEQEEREKADKEKQDSAQKDSEYYLPSPIYVLSYDSEVAPALRRNHVYIVPVTLHIHLWYIRFKSVVYCVLITYVLYISWAQFYL